MQPKPTLVVDLDGTLTPADTLLESIVALLRRRPVMLFQMLGWLLSGRARFKARLAHHVRLDVSRLPWREDFVAWLKEERAGGRRLVLATAAHVQIASDVALHLPLFDRVVGSDETRNAKGLHKLEVILQDIGPGFVYAGDSPADLPIWSAAGGAVLVGCCPSVSARVRARTPVEREFPRTPTKAATWLRAIRVHQWVKNVLLFVPLLTSFTFTEADRVLAAFAAFLSFSFAASGTYLMNDLWDLDADRQHPRKRNRPLAAADISIVRAIAVAGALLVLGCALAATVSARFLAVLAGYVILTTAYSWVLKRYVLMDVIALALLYTYRVLAGAIAIDVGLTPWLLAFSVFVFLSLALIKRCAELVTLAEQQRVASSGRDYNVGDLVVLWPLGVGAGICSVVVFGLFIGSPEARATYGDTSPLWLVGVGLLYWTGRMWIKTARGEMHDDPIVFALRDRGSRIALAAMIGVPLAAHFFR